MNARCVLLGTLFLVLPTVVSCVPYKRYAAARDELDRAKRANEDLVRRLNHEITRRQSGTVPAAGMAPDVLALNEQLRGELDRRDRNPFTKEDLGKLPAGKVVLDDGGLSLGSDLLFPPGVANLKPSHLSVLDSVANLLKTSYAGEKFILEGHTDDTPLKSTKKLYGDNWNLGYQRAHAVFEFFSKEHGIAKEDMLIVTYGYLRPVAPNSTAEGKRQNRRVVIRRGGEIRGNVAVRR
jgi:chemotaxis protein MotB